MRFLVRRIFLFASEDPCEQEECHPCQKKPSPQSVEQKISEGTPLEIASREGKDGEVQTKQQQNQTCGIGYQQERAASEQLFLLFQQSTAIPLRDVFFLHIQFITEKSFLPIKMNVKKSLAL